MSTKNEAVVRHRCSITLTGTALVLLLAVATLASGPALLERHQTETAMPRVQQAVTDTTVERWVADTTSEADDEVVAERRLVSRLDKAGIDTVVLGMEAGARYDPERVRRLSELQEQTDLRVILAVPTFASARADRVRAEVREVADRTDATVLLPQVTENHPGLPTNPDSVSWMRDFELALTDLEGGTSVRGIDAVARPGHTVRAHEIPVGVDESRAGLQSRALRAVKERGVRLLVYRYTSRQQMAPPKYTTDVASAVASRLPGQLGSSEGRERTDSSGAEGSGSPPEDALVGGASALTESRPVWSIPSWLGLPVGLLGATGAALMVATPTHRRDSPGGPWRRGTSFGLRLVAALGTTVVTGLVVAASGANWASMVGIAPFTGVKLLLLGPPLAVALLGCLRHREVLRAAATPRRLALIAALAAAVIGVYLLRSGNVGIAFTPELWLRDRLDDLLYIRPRFKEMLIGVPALTIAALAYAHGPARSRGADLVRWLLLAFGAIGTASVVDTFAHFHTPVWTGLLRTGYAIAIGVPLGLAMCWLYRARVGALWQRRTRRREEVRS